MEDKQTQKLAALNLRGIAAIIDMIILFVMELILLSPFLTYATYIERELGEDWFSFLFILIMLPLWLVYFVVQEGIWGQTIGKRITKIKVVKVNGKKAGWLKVLLRNLFRFVDLIGPCPYGVGLFSIVFTKNKQRIGDIIAKTVVIRVSKKGNQNE